MPQSDRTIGQWADDMMAVLDALELAELCLAEVPPIPVDGSPAERPAALMRVCERLAGDISSTEPEAAAEEFRQAQAKRARTIEARLVALMAGVSTAIPRIQ